MWRKSEQSFSKNTQITKTSRECQLCRRKQLLMRSQRRIGRVFEADRKATLSQITTLYNSAGPNSRSEYTILALRQMRCREREKKKATSCATVHRKRYPDGPQLRTKNVSIITINLVMKHLYAVNNSAEIVFFGNCNLKQKCPERHISQEESMPLKNSNKAWHMSIAHTVTHRLTLGFSQRCLPACQQQ